MFAAAAERVPELVDEADSRAASAAPGSNRCHEAGVPAPRACDTGDEQLPANASALQQTDPFLPEADDLVRRVVGGQPLALVIGEFEVGGGDGVVQVV